MLIFYAIDLRGVQVLRLKKGRNIIFFALIILAGLLSGCADTPPLGMSLPSTDNLAPNPAVADHSVIDVKDGEQNRSTIDASNQQIYNAEHMDSGSPQHPSASPDPGIP